MKKEAVFCLCLCTALMLVSSARASSVGSTATSSADIKSVAAQFLAQVAGFNTSKYQITLSTPNGPSMIPSTHVTPHFETDISATISNEYGQSNVVFSFIDGNFWLYDSSSLQGNLKAPASEQGFNDSLNTMITVANGCRGLFNASYWSDFAQLVSAALQTQQLKTENENFLLEIENGSILWATCYAKIDGQYTSPFRSMQVSVSGTGLVTTVSDGMRRYYVATTNVTVSKDQAIAIAEPYIEDFAKKNQQNVTAINATFEYSPDSLEQRGESYAMYPAWSIHATYDKPGEYNASGYSVDIWADNGEIAAAEPEIRLGSSASTNAPFDLRLLSLPCVAVVFAVAFGVFLKRKSRARRN